MQFMEKAETYATGHFFNHTLQVGALGEYGEKMSCILKSIKEWKKKLASGEKLLCFNNVNILWG